MSYSAGSVPSDASAASADAEHIASCSRAALELERLRVQAEIVGYPMPIPACDVYFNGLLEQRARICEALGRLGPQECHGGG